MNRFTFILISAILFSQAISGNVFAATDLTIDLDAGYSTGESRTTYNSETEGLGLSKWSAILSSSSVPALNYRINHINLQPAIGKIFLSTDTGLVVLNYSTYEIEAVYSKTSSPALPTISNQVNTTLYDDQTGLLYMGMLAGGVVVLDTINNDIEGHYKTTAGTYPAINGDNIVSLFLDEGTNRLYIAAQGGLNSGLTIINLTGNTVYKKYSASTNPGFSDGFLKNVFVDPVTKYAYVTEQGYGITVVDPATDTIVRQYTLASSPAIGINTPLGSFVNENDGYLYVYGRNDDSVTVIDTVNNVIVRKLNLGSNPSLAAYNVSNAFVDSDNNLFVTYYDGAFFMNLDTNVVKDCCSLLMDPNSNFTHDRHSVLDETSGLLYMADGSSGMKIIAINNKYVQNGDFVSAGIKIDDYAAINTVKNAVGTIGVSYRLGDSNALWTVNFSDGDTSGTGDLDGMSGPYDLTESGGVVTIAPSIPSDWIYYMTETNRTVSTPFPGGSLITVKVKVVQTENSPSLAIITEGENQYLYFDTSIPNDEWVTINFAPSDPFYDVGVTFTELSSVQISDIRVTLPDGEWWGDWSEPCSTVDCPVTGLEVADSLQVKYTLATTDDSTTPRITSATLKAVIEEEPPADPQPEEETPQSNRSGSKPLTALKKQVAELLEMVAKLQAQISAVQNSSTTGYIPLVSCPDMEIGFKGNCAKELQVFLNKNKFTVSETGAGSEGNETELFGSATRTALSKFQAANNISPAAGYFGPVTRKVIEIKY